MCKASQILKNLIASYQEVNAEYNSLSKELSRCDLIEQDILHILENSKFNAADGYFYAKKIKDNRIERSRIKLELTTIQKVTGNIKISAILKQLQQLELDVELQELDLKKNTFYKPRILKDII